MESIVRPLQQLRNIKTLLIGALFVMPLVALTLTAPAKAASLSAADQAFVDATVKASMAKYKNSEYLFSMTGPKGDYTKAYGVSNKLTKKAATTPDHFRIGSTTKLMTSMAILKLVDQGKLKLTDKLSQFVSGVPNGNIITIQHLLMMRSGVFDYQADTSVQVIMNLFPSWNFSPAGALKIVRSKPAQFTPGTKYQYTNSNYMLLGYVMEKITGQPYQTVITNSVIKPLGLTQTGFPNPKTFQNPAMPAPVAHGYGSVIYGANYDITHQNPALFGPAGAAWSTIGDMNKLGNAMRNLTIFSPEMRTLHKSTFCKVAAPQPAPNPQAFGYGMGLISYGRWMGHGGSIPGYSNANFYDTQSGAAIAAFENTQTATSAALTDVTAKVAERLYPGSMATQQYPSC